MLAINTLTYKLAEFLVPALKSLTSNEYMVKDSFAFAKKIVEQDSEVFTGSLDVDSLFTEIPLEETIEESKELLSLATKESYFIFNEKPYKQVDGVAMGSSLGPTLANAFLVHFEKSWSQNCPSDFKPHYYWQYGDDIYIFHLT